MGAETTTPGYENRNGQIVVGPSDAPGNHHNQTLYRLRCSVCENRYRANGCDIHLRKCPACQGGARSSHRPTEART